MRTELVKQQSGTSEYDLAAQREAQLAYSYNFCSISNRPLREPILSCALGRMDIKDAILEHLISPETNNFPHIKSLKDLVELKLKRDGNHFICPISLREMNGRSTKFAYIASCGHVFERSVLKGGECILCSTKFAPEVALVTINPRGEDYKAAYLRIDRLAARGLSHALKRLSFKPAKRNIETDASKELV